MDRRRPAEAEMNRHTALQMARSGAELVLRLPSLLLLELWFRARVRTQPTDWRDLIIANPKLSSYLEVVQLLHFIQSRNLDESAAHILSYATLLLCSLMLLLPARQLVNMYLHATSLGLLGFAHYMSYRYVQLEQETGGELILDDFVKLERHGFHFLAQVMIGLGVSCLLGLQRDLARAALAVFMAPTVARMCSFPLDKLHVVHNFACCFAMVVIGLYTLNTGPALLLWTRRAYRQLRATVVVRGPVGGTLVLWRRLQLPRLLLAFWLALFCAQLYAKSEKYQHSPIDVPLLLLAATADCTATPLSLSALGVAVSYVAAGALCVTKVYLFGSVRPVPADARVSSSHLIEALTMLLLFGQTGILELKATQRALMLGLVFVILTSAILQSLFELLEPHLLALGASPQSSAGRHLRALSLAALLLVGPVVMACNLSRLLQFDMWLLIILSSCLLTSLQTVSTMAVYALFLVEARCREPWERLDELVFVCRATTRVLEFGLAVVVICCALAESLVGRWSWLSVVVLAVHCYFNVYGRLQAGWQSFQQRRGAAESINLLARADSDQLQLHNDVCSICIGAMSEARVTPCGHLFHGACLRKWLFVRQSCPLCHASVKLGAERRPRVASARSEEGYSSEWPTDEDSVDADSASEQESEYTVATDSPDEL